MRTCANGLGFRGLEFRVWGLGFGVRVSGSREGTPI